MTTTSSTHSSCDDTRIAKFWAAAPSLLNDCATSDFTIVVNDKHFAVHKFVLGLHSDVFRAMFEYDMFDTSLNELTISEFSAETVSEFLRALYDPTLTTLNHAMNVYTLANKYKINSVCQTLLLQITNEISDESVVDTILFASMHSLQPLKQTTFKYFLEHPNACADIPNLTDTLGASLRNELIKFILTNITSCVVSGGGGGAGQSMRWDPIRGRYECEKQ
jgi:hypothetical protein